MDTNIRIEHKKLTTTSTSMNEEDEDEFTLMFDGFWKAYPANCVYRANVAFTVSYAAKMAAFPVRPRQVRLFPWRTAVERRPYR